MHPLLAALLGPALPGAACVGLAPAFDLHLDGAGETDDERADRHQVAARVCAGCPAATACASTAAADDAAAGVWAGTVHRPRPRRRPGTAAA